MDIALTRDEVMAKLDEWVSRHGDGTYTSPTNRATPEDSAIQQVRSEVADFVEVVLGVPGHTDALEVGMGRFGGTHYLWSLMYDHVGSIECLHPPIRAYRGEPTFNPERDVFFHGSSHDPFTVFSVHTHFVPEGVDLLFIDGAHDKPSVLTDFILYGPLVKTGGVVAFHDVVEDCPGGPKWVTDFLRGVVNIHTITYAKDCGIAWFQKGVAV